MSCILHLFGVLVIVSRYIVKENLILSAIPLSQHHKWLESEVWATTPTYFPYFTSEKSQGRFLKLWLSLGHSLHSYRKQPTGPILSHDFSFNYLIFKCFKVSIYSVYSMMSVIMAFSYVLSCLQFIVSLLTALP